MNGGRVALVGAGPGDPALLTIRAVELLRAADVVAYDELVSDAILAMVPSGVELLAIGRRAGIGETNYRLHPAVMDRARSGLFVVRLKAGDPLIFGRGAEEARELAEAGIPYEIVPGITAASGAAAYAAVPLTHRDHAGKVSFVTGHRRTSVAFGEARREQGTVVLYMGARALRENVAAMIADGRDPETPAVLVAAATTPDEIVIEASLQGLADEVERRGVVATGLPCLVIVGDVASERGAIAWRSALPLHKKTVLVARARPGASRLACLLRSAGATVVELPHVERTLRGAVALGETDAVSFDIVLIASAEAAEACTPVLANAAPVMAIGADVASQLRSRGVFPVSVLAGSCDEAIAAASGELDGKHVLVPVTEGGRSKLVTSLRKVGAVPRVIPIATDERGAPARWPARIDLVALPASSAAEALYGMAPASLREVVAVAIGPKTRDAATHAGVRTVMMSERDTPESMVSAIVKALSSFHAETGAEPDG